MTAELNVAVADTPARGLATLARADLAALGLRSGDTARLEGHRTTHVRVMAGAIAAGTLRVDPAIAANAGLAEGARARLHPADLPALEAVVLRAVPPAEAPGDLEEALFDMALSEGDRLPVALPRGRRSEIEVVATTPPAAGLFGAGTTLALETQPGAAPVYDGIGGLEEEIARVHEMIAAPLLRPDLYQRLGIAAPRGVLFTGPPGSGKTLLARAVAARTEAAFFHVNAPEIVSKHYGDSEAALRKVFETAERRAPAIVFIDEIDAIAPRRDALSGEKQVERRVVAQLLTLLDGLDDRGRVVVMAATNLPDSLDPALRRPGRFDREIAFRPPTPRQRREILGVHLARAPLAPDVRLDGVAEAAHGYVGADLAALAREAAVAALARTVAAAGGEAQVRPEDLRITAADLAHGLAVTRPSALRSLGGGGAPVRWDEIGGGAALRETLERAVLWPMRHREAGAALGLRPARGVLLTGPPGSGKTLAVRALATESGLNFLPVRPPRLLSQYLGEAERAVEEVFATARATAPALLFFDELDALAPSRGRADATLDRVIAQLLLEFDALASHPGVVVMAATNRAAAIDPALTRPGRFDLVVPLPLPDAAARAAILAVHLRHRATAGGLALDALAVRTEGWSGAELALLVEEAARGAFARAVAGGAAQLEAGDLDAAVAVLAAARAARRTDHIQGREGAE